MFAAIVTVLLLARSKAGHSGWLVQGDFQSPAALSAFVITAWTSIERA
jgi:hypothetical protein